MITQKRTFLCLVSFLLRLPLIKPSDLRFGTENHAYWRQLTELTATTHRETLYIIHRTTHNILLHQARLQLLTLYRIPSDDMTNR